jgi:Ni,Fe-hydrogenase I small subunit
VSGLAIGGIVVGAIGLVAVGVGAGLGATVLSDASDAENDDTLCPAMQCSPAGRDVIDTATTKAHISTVLLAVGGAATLGGVVMLALGLTDDSSGDTALSVMPIVGPGQGGVVIRF